MVTISFGLGFVIGLQVGIIEMCVIYLIAEKLSKKVRNARGIKRK